jgi:hypothetical protein
MLQGGYYLMVVSFRFPLTLCFINSIENSLSALLVATASKYVLTSYTNLHFSVVLHVILSTQQQTSVSQNKQPSQQPQCILYIEKSYTKSHTQNEGLLFCLIFRCVSLCEPYEGILLPCTVCPEGKN